MKVLISFFLICGLASSAFAQSANFILLKRGTKTKSQIRIYEGQYLTYKSAKLGYYVTDQIQRISTEFIYLSENILEPKDILEIDIRELDRRNSTLRNLNLLTLGSGMILLAADGANSLYQQGNLTIDSGVGMYSGLLIGTGLILLPIRYKKFKHVGRNKIQLIQMQIDS